MRKITLVLLLSLLLPPLWVASSAAGYHGGRGYGYGHHGAPPPSYYSGYGGYRGYRGGYYYNNNDWAVPVAIFGGLLGMAALFQMMPTSSSYAAPAPQRFCTDTYNYYDQYGNYRYTEYVDRPCRN